MYYEDKPPIHEYYNQLYGDSTIYDTDEDSAAHIGVKRRSGRYPYGSGKEPYQHGGDFLSRVKELKKAGLSESKIAETMGIVNEKGRPSSTLLRTQMSIAKDEQRSLLVAQAKSLKSDGLTLKQIADKMGYANDSSVRALLDEKAEIRMNQARETAKFLKEQVDSKGMIDVGVGVERELKISKEKLDQALYILETEGYDTYGGRVPQATNPNQKTTLKVLCPPGTEHKDIYNYGEIHSVNDYISRDDGVTFEKKFHYPASMDSKRLKIRYADDVGPDGVKGIEKDGLIELRRGVEDLSLGEKTYSQVRILVDGSHYIKGMAVYSDNMPDGVDVVFNTNKKSDVPMKKVLKAIKSDPDNPFGSAIKDAEKGGQYWYNDSKTGERKLGLINKRADEGDWSEWKDKLPSQFLSKQPLSLAKKQLNMAIADKQQEYDEICSLTNPTVKKRLLSSFADDCDSAAVHLSAAALPRQKYHVIIPIGTLKDNEIYAPKYNDGEQLALIRYPHGGTFEIPVLTVNNKHRHAKELLGNVQDAVGINSKVAERLSGADFDGDTVMVIPTNDKVKIKSTPQLKKLEGFDPKMQYGTEERTDGYYNARGQKIKVMKNTQNEMGRISNLITDMTLKGATDDEKARAVKHSMVVIDAEKHKLDYKQSYVDNGIESLKKKYQGHYDEDGRYKAGAATLISRAKSETSVDKRQGTPKINIKGKDYYDPTKPEGSLLYKTADDLYYPDRSYDKETGIVTLRTTAGKKVQYSVSDKAATKKYEPIEKVDPDTGAVTYTNKDGSISYRVKTRSQSSTKMAETDDAYTLISDDNTPMERAYADYANKMKALANDARKEMVTTGKIEYSSAAKKTYQKEVDSLTSKLNDALKNAPRERQAQVIANSVIEAKKQANPDMTKEDIKKTSQQELSKARIIVGAKRTTIDITDKEWEAIQAGAISESNLTKILNNTDIDVIRERATPRSTKTLNSSKVNRIKSMNANGYTLNEIAKALGVSTSTVSNYIK